MAYFDNAATTYPKPEVVYTSMDKFYRLNGANAGRGRYNLAQSANALIGETRVLVQELLHCPAKQVVFTPTATIALNIIIQGLICKGAKTIYTAIELVETSYFVQSHCCHLLGLRLKFRFSRKRTLMRFLGTFLRNFCILII